jgi:hypothetical protein
MKRQGPDMTMADTHFGDPAQEVRPRDKGILSRTPYAADRPKAVLWCWAQGQEPSEHTDSVAASRISSRAKPGRCRAGDSRSRADAGRGTR